MRIFNEKELILIDQYLSGELEGDALLLFKKEITQDDDLKKEVNLRKSITDGISNYGNLKARIRDLDHKNEAVRNTKKWTLALAATLLFFIFSAIIYFSFSGKEEIILDQIIADISIDSKYIPEIRNNRGSSTVDIEREFKNSYNDANYSYCVGVCDNLQNDSLRNELSIYCGFSNESIGQYKKAINIYDNIIQRNEKHVTEALFHKAFCHLKLKEKNESITALELVVASKEDSPFQEKAEKILNNLKEMKEGEWID